MKLSDEQPRFQQQLKSFLLHSHRYYRSADVTNGRMLDALFVEYCKSLLVTVAVDSF